MNNPRTRPRRPFWHKLLPPLIGFPLGILVVKGFDTWAVPYIGQFAANVLSLVSVLLLAVVLGLVHFWLLGDKDDPAWAELKKAARELRAEADAEKRRERKGTGRRGGT